MRDNTYTYTYIYIGYVFQTFIYYIGIYKNVLYGIYIRLCTHMWRVSLYIQLNFMTILLLNEILVKFPLGKKRMVLLTTKSNVYAVCMHVYGDLYLSCEGLSCIYLIYIILLTSYTTYMYTIHIHTMYCTPRGTQDKRFYVRQ